MSGHVQKWSRFKSHISIARHTAGEIPVQCTIDAYRTGSYDAIVALSHLVVIIYRRAGDHEGIHLTSFQPAYRTEKENIQWPRNPESGPHAVWWKI